MIWRSGNRSLSMAYTSSVFDCLTASSSQMCRRIADSAAQDARHDADVEVSPPEDRAASVLDVFRDVLITEAGVNPAG